MDIIDYLAVKPTFINLGKAIDEYWNPKPENDWYSIELLCTELTIKKECNKFGDLNYAESMLNDDPQKCKILWG